jgi:hypothetical protein
MEWNQETKEDFHFVRLLKIMCKTGGFDQGRPDCMATYLERLNSLDAHGVLADATMRRR